MILEIKSNHPWYEFITKEVDKALEGASSFADPNILASIKICGAEEFFRLDSIYEVTSFARGGERVFKTEWKQVWPRS